MQKPQIPGSDSGLPSPQAKLPSEGFDIVFKGQLAPSASLAQVQLNLAQLFKMPQEKVLALFRDSAVVLKRGLDLAAAQRYQAAILKAGALVELVPSLRDSPPVNPSPPILPTSQTSTPLQTPPTEWGLSAQGDNLLAPSERVVFESRLNEFVEFELRKVGNLLDDNERPFTPPVEVRGDFQLAPVGSDVLSPAERQAPVEPAVEAGDWQLSAVGERLSVPVKVTAVAPDTAHLSLQKPQ